MPRVPAVFLDRDGVINQAVVRDGNPYPPARLEDVQFLSGAKDFFKKLTDHGYILIGITNQPDVARGTQSREVVEQINDLIVSSLPVKEIFMCYHDDGDDCTCRKPKPGLILQAAEKYQLDLSRSWMIGDRWKDIAAGAAAGLQTIFVDYEYNEIYRGPQPGYTIAAVSEAAQIILKKEKK
jgi:D-glycero-D-manno-heptose 1,7-bisphosphate phosphatase